MLAASRLLSNVQRRFTGKSDKGSSQRRSRSCDPSQAVKRQLFVERLAQLRQDIEEKTQRLNDRSFEVTEDWLFEFASQHAEYMEQATSRAGSNAEFRSTTDLFQHVLQHPSVQKLMIGWQPAPAAAPCCGAADSMLSGCPETPLKQVQRWSPGRTETPGSAEGIIETPGSAEYDSQTEGAASPEVEPAVELAPLVDTTAVDASMDGGSKDSVDNSTLQALQQAGAPEVAPELAPEVALVPDDACASGMKATSSHGVTAFGLHHRSSWPAPMTPLRSEDGESQQKPMRASSTSRVARASWPAVEAKPPADDGELMRKLRQRPSWQGLLSPRSRRLADQSKGASPEKTDKLTLAARRKSLESKLASCGFQKTAQNGGA